MKHLFFSSLLLVSLVSCKQLTPGQHDGKYVFTDSTRSPLLEESVFIHGQTATLRFRSLFNKAKTSKTKFLCFQDSGKIVLYMGKRQRPLNIQVNQQGNLLIDGHVFTKQQVPVISTTPVSSFFLQPQKK